MDYLNLNIDEFMRTVFVGNIPYEITKEKIEDIFNEVGQVSSFQLEVDQETGKSKGYGFCMYKNRETALKAIKKINDYKIEGRNLRVKKLRIENLKPQNLLLQMREYFKKGNIFCNSFPLPKEPVKNSNKGFSQNASAVLPPIRKTKSLPNLCNELDSASLVENVNLIFPRPVYFSDLNLNVINPKISPKLPDNNSDSFERNRNMSYSLKMKRQSPFLSRRRNELYPPRNYNVNPQEQIDRLHYSRLRPRLPRRLQYPLTLLRMVITVEPQMIQIILLPESQSIIIRIIIQLKFEFFVVSQRPRYESVVSVPEEQAPQPISPEMINRVASKKSSYQKKRVALVPKIMHLTKEEINAMPEKRRKSIVSIKKVIDKRKKQ